MNTFENEELPEESDLRALDEAMRLSRGNVFINLTHTRSFSLNIFRTNAQELIAASRQMRDPDEAIRLMAVDNREAGDQAHREINRLVHNFVTSSMTLIDHTRALVQANYPGGALESAYHDRVKVDFASEPVAKFVKDLRNYMVHKGLPNSEMFLNFDNTHDKPGEQADLTTGVHYPTSSLMEWNGWTAPAKVYLAAAGEYLDIHTFAEAYLEKVLSFHHWLDTALFQHHADDLESLQRMQADYGRRTAEAAARSRFEATPSDGPASVECEPSEELRPSAPLPVIREIDEAGEAILSAVRRIDFAPREPASFVSERPVNKHIQSDEIIGMPIAWCSDAEGRRVVAFLKDAGDIYGLDADIFAGLTPLSEKVLTLDWARNTLSRKFIEDAVLDWCRSSFRSETRVNLSDALTASTRENVAPREVWAPIINLEIESAFALGPATIAPITAAMLKDLETKGIAMSPGQRDDVAALFYNLREKMQGYAAVVLHIESEQTRAQDEGFSLAQDAVGILRFFSPVAGESRRVCSTTLMGAENVPRRQLMVLGESDFSFTDGVTSNPYYWRLSNENLAAIKRMGLEAANVLVSPDGLSDFALAVRTGLLLYSTGTTLHNHADRLIYALSAVETILIRHSMEPAEFNVEERLMLLLATDKPSREVVARNIREAYRLRRRYVAILTPYEQNSLATFARNAHLALSIALENLDRFKRKAEFIEAIDRRKGVLISNDEVSGL